MPTSPWLLIDGYNLLHASSVFGRHGRTSLERSREALLDWLARVLEEPQRQRTTVVFDAREAPPGLPDTLQKHGLQIRFAPRGGEADELLELLILEHSSPRNLVVVSSDHRVQRAARRRRAQAIDSELWVVAIQRTHETGATESAERQEPPVTDIQAWLDAFREP